MNIWWFALGSTVFLGVISILMVLVHIKLKSRWVAPWMLTAVASTALVALIGLKSSAAQVSENVHQPTPQTTEDVVAQPVEQTQSVQTPPSSSLTSINYLQEILSLLKAGKPIPEKYQAILPESISAPSTVPVLIHQPKPSSTLPNQTPPPSVSVVVKQKETTALNPVPAEQTPKQQAEPVPGASSKPVPAKKEPIDARKTPTFLAQTLHRSQATVRSYFSSVYAQPLQQSDTKDVFLQGSELVEVSYEGGQASQVRVTYESLPEAAKRRDWSTFFANRIGAQDATPTESSDGLMVWKSAYLGIAVLEYHRDLINQKGWIIAR